MDQWTVPCTVYRGGTSRGLFFQKKDIPTNTEKRNFLFMSAIDSWNGSQVDGLGGMTSSTSKVCVVGPSERAGADVDWTFFQLAIENQIVDEKGTCGNLMSAVGAFAVDEGMVKVAKDATTAIVNVYHTNLDKMIRIEVPVEDGVARTTGNFQMAGIYKPGARLFISIMNPGGENTGSINKIGVTSVGHGLKNKGGKTYQVTFSDVLNPFVFVNVIDLGLDGGESSSLVGTNKELLAELAAIREDLAVQSGIANNSYEAKEVIQNIPKIAIVAKPVTYTTNSGNIIDASEMDIAIKVISMGKLHKASPASCLYNIAVSSAIEGTVINQIVGKREGSKRLIRIGHPGGVTEVFVEIDEKTGIPLSVGVERTIRRIMKGEVYVPYNSSVS